MRVLHVSPTHFGDASIVGGAERYAWELARAMAAEVDVTFLTFGTAPAAFDRDGVHVEVLRHSPLIDHPLASNPISRAFLSAVRRADVVHCHQVHTFATNAAVLCGRAIGRPVFVTDLGGGHMRAPSSYVGVMRLATGFLLISDYSRRMWADAPRSTRPDRLEAIYAGVDVDQFSPGGFKNPHGVLYVGRLLPHKGVEHLIDAITPPLTLRIVGRPYDAAYVAMLCDRAKGKPIVFEEGVDDRGLVDRYRSALVSVLPSASTDWVGRTTTVAELFGLVVIEAMACGTPAIVSNTTSLPELVDDGMTGFVVPARDAGALRERLLQLSARPDLAAAMGARARDAVCRRFTWAATAARCLEAYRRGHAA